MVGRLRVVIAVWDVYLTFAGLVGQVQQARELDMQVG